VSPLALRRYRAERLLRRDFHALRPVVLAGARRRLDALRVHVDEADLEACYAQAWHGLYATMLAGEPVASPGGWLTTVTVRRAIDDQRHEVAPPAAAERLGGGARPLTVARPADPQQRLDDLTRLREVFEALRGRLTERECAAASLCYLQGLPRAEAAQRMGISPRRMDKLMDGNGAGAPGVAAKVGELLACIRRDRWCEEQASLMRGYAFGLLDPRGERHRLAVMHQRECPGCRAYVASLRGLAATLPPVSLPWAAVAGGAAAATAGGSAAAGGGGWLLLGGSVTAKVAAGCLLAVGLGCLALTRPAGPPAPRHTAVAVPRPHRQAPTRGGAAAVAVAARGAVPWVPARGRAAGGSHSARAAHRTEHRAARASAVTPAARAGREFGLEASRPSPPPSAPPAPAPLRASAASAGSPPAGGSASGGSAGAEREFGVQ
jgi:DNA-directed RNA polymerase specialized sigma24 family protein